MKLIIAFVCVFILFKLQAILYRTTWKKGFHAGISFRSNTCQEGEKNVLIEVVTNNKLLPLPMVHVKFNTPRSFLFDDAENSSVTDYYYRDDVFTILSRQTIKRELTFTCSCRGCYYMQDLSVITSDLLMREVLSAKISNNQVIHVYPKKLSMRPFEIPFRTIMGEFATQKNVAEDPFEFRGIREYQPYDAMRSINWKSSAKLGSLQVNTFFTTASQEVVLFLNLDSEVYSKSRRLQETAIRIASTLACNFISQGISVALETNGHDLFTRERICKKSGSGADHMEMIDHSLSRIDLSLPYTDYTDMVMKYFSLENASLSSGRNAFYLFISTYRHENLISYYLSLKSAGLSCYYIVPEYKMIPVELTAPDMIKWEVE